MTAQHLLCNNILTRLRALPRLLDLMTQQNKRYFRIPISAGYDVFRSCLVNTFESASLVPNVGGNPTSKIGHLQNMRMVGRPSLIVKPVRSYLILAII